MTQPKTRVIVESPFAGATARIMERNERYLRACLRDCLMRGEAPFASHGLYTLPGVLDDGNAVERKLGILAGFAWRPVAELTAVYDDYGITECMMLGVDHAEATGQRVEFRQLRGQVLA